MEKTVTLVIEPATWCDQAAAFLATTIRGAPCYTIEDMRAEIAAGGAQLYRARDQASGELAGFIVMRLELYQGGAEGVLVAAAGAIAGAKLYRQVLPALERMFKGVRSIRIEACRKGAVRELTRAGYLPTHAILRKVVTPLRGDDVLEELQACGGEAMGEGHRGSGGPDLRSRPGKLYGGGGGKSESTSTQQTTNIDKRLVVDGGSIGLSSDTSTVAVTVNTLDAGAIDKAIALVSASDQQVSKSLSDVLGFAESVFGTAASSIERASRSADAAANLAATSADSAASLASKAYDNAKGDGTVKNVLVAAALATVGIVAIKAFAK